MPLGGGQACNAGIALPRTVQRACAGANKPVVGLLRSWEHAGSDTQPALCFAAHPQASLYTEQSSRATAACLSQVPYRTKSQDVLPCMGLAIVQAMHCLEMAAHLKHQLN